MAELESLQNFEKRLEKVNGIIKEIAANEKNISPIVPADYPLFEDFFAKEEKHTYGNSWIYVTQGTFGIGPEKLGYKYSDGKNLCTLSIFPKIEDPSTIMLYWTRPLGKEMMSIIVKYAEKIKQKYGICSYVKKIFPEQYDFLLRNGFRSTKEYPWHSSAHSEDDTYPELIYDREQTLEALDKASGSVALGRAKRGVAKIRRENNVEMTDANFQTIAWHIIQTYFYNRNNQGNKINISTPFDYYNMIFRNHNRSVKKKYC